MKKLFLVCCFLIGISTISLAQRRGRLTPAETVAAMKTSLSLNDEQVTGITAILTKQSKTRDSLVTALNGDFGTVRQTMMPIMQADVVKIKALLTPDQAKAYQKQLDDAQR